MVCELMRVDVDGHLKATLIKRKKEGVIYIILVMDELHMRDGKTFIRE